MVTERAGESPASVMLRKNRGVRRAASALRRRLRRSLISAAIRRRGRDDLVRLGSDYGGWTVPGSLLDEKSICYSAGVGEDTTFDVELIERFGCEVFALDPTPKALRHGEQVAESVPRFHFIPVGLAARDGARRFHAPKHPDHASYSMVNLQQTRDSVTAECWSLPTLMRRLGHPAIDLLKADIEGGEYEVLDSLPEAKTFPTVVCVEFHGGIGSTLRAIRGLARNGYSLAHQEGENVTVARDRPST